MIGLLNFIEKHAKYRPSKSTEDHRSLKKTLLKFTKTNSLQAGAPRKMSGRNLITLEKIGYHQGKYMMLKEVDWTVKKGENWIIFGPNGSGKTTILKILTGYIRPSQGTATILNEVIGRTNLPKLRKRLAWVSSSLHSLITSHDPVIEIVVAGRNASTRMWEMPSKDELEKAISLLDQLGCKHLMRLPFGMISQGEQKKVLIARSLMLDPEIIILDEPCEGLDIASRESFLKDIGVMATSNGKISLIMVTHHVEEIIPVFNKVLIMKKGEVYNQGDIDDMLTSEQLTELFGVELSITKRKERFECFLK